MAHSTTSAMEPVALRLKARPDLPVILYNPRICARLQPCKGERKGDCLPLSDHDGISNICARLQPHTRVIFGATRLAR